MESQEYGYAANNLRRLSAEIGRNVIIPKVSRDVMAAVIGSNLEGNGILLDGAPGGGKTKGAKAAAAAIGGTFRRVQGTADLLPFDITGSEFINRETGKLEFQEGPIFANFLLVDEINRAAPKTQSALLEGMQEGTVTVGNQTHRLPDPHYIIATRNPEEIAQGTYPLPLANIDRFAVSINMPNLTRDQKKAALNYNHSAEQVTTTGDLVWTANTMSGVFVDDSVINHAVRTVEILDSFDMVDSDYSVLGSGRILPNTIAIAKSLTAFDGEAGNPEVGYNHVDTVLRHVLAHRTAVAESHADSYQATAAMAIDAAIALSYQYA